MIGLLFRRAQATVDNAIGLAVSRAIVATPFLIAGGFAVAALQVRLHREFDPEIANLLLAGLFLVVGFITLIVVNVRMRASAGAQEPAAAPAQTSAAEPAAEALSLDLHPQDRELLAAALTSVAPLALPSIIGIVMRNLPALLAAAAALFAVYRLALAPDDAEANEPNQDGSSGPGAQAAPGSQAAQAA